MPTRSRGFFDIPVDNVYASPLTLADIWKHYTSDEIIVVSPDVGGVVRARAIAKRLDADLAIIDKRRPRANEATVMNLIGDVDGKICVLVDDMIDTAGTLCSAAGALKDKGARKVVAYCVHPMLSGPAIDNISNSQYRRDRRHRHHSVESGSHRLRPHPPALGCPDAGRNHSPHVGRGVGQFALRRLKPLSLES
jgi:ribose-phosphate pyrophosphokinase